MNRLRRGREKNVHCITLIFIGSGLILSDNRIQTGIEEKFKNIVDPTNFYRSEVHITYPA